MSDAGSFADEATMLDAGEAALVTTGGMTDLEMLLPKFKDNDIVPELVIFVLACYLRGCEDQAFYDDVLSWFEEDLERAQSLYQ